MTKNTTFAHILPWLVDYLFFDYAQWQSLSKYDGLWYRSKILLEISSVSTELCR